jgi:DNA end-binding protein Ku
MPRAIWNGAISFGLVNIPIGLYSATEEKDIHFHNMTTKGHRVRNKRVDEKTGREVDFDDIVKGYETSRGKYVLIDPDELDAASPEQTRSIEIEDFVELAEIDPIHFEATYYIAPRSGGGGDKAYALLREAMLRKERVGIGRFVMRTKQYLVAIRPAERLLLLDTLYFADEIRSTKEIDVPARMRGNTRELKIAEKLIDDLTVQWDPERYHDTYRAELLNLIKRKQRGEEITVEEPQEERAKVVDLMEALEASLEARGGRSGGRNAKRGTRRRKKAS